MNQLEHCNIDLKGILTFCCFCTHGHTAATMQTDKTFFGGQNPPGFGPSFRFWCAVVERPSLQGWFWTPQNWTPWPYGSYPPNISSWPPASASCSGRQHHRVSRRCGLSFAKEPVPSHQLTWKCTDPCRKTTFLLERALLQLHVSWWEGKSNKHVD